MSPAESTVEGWEILAFLALIAAGVAVAVLDVVLERREERRKREANLRRDDQAVAVANSGRQPAAAPRFPEPAPDDGGWLAAGLDEALRRITEGQP